MWSDGVCKSQARFKFTIDSLTKAFEKNQLGPEHATSRSSQHKPAYHKGPGKKKAEVLATSSTEGVDASMAAPEAGTAGSDHAPPRAPRQRGKERADRGGKRGADGGQDGERHAGGAGLEPGNTPRPATAPSRWSSLRPKGRRKSLMPCSAMALDSGTCRLQNRVVEAVGWQGCGLSRRLPGHSEPNEGVATRGSRWPAL